MYRSGILLALLILGSTAQDDPAAVEADSAVAPAPAVEAQVAQPGTGMATSETDAVSDTSEEDAMAGTEGAGAAGQAKAVEQAEAEEQSDEALIVEEEDIFTEIGRQGIRLDAQEESLFDEEAEAEREAGATEVAGSDSAADSSSTPVAGPGEDPLIETSVEAGPRKAGPRAGKQAGTAVSSDTTPLPKARIDDVRSINFARNLKEYRSPKLAMFLSLLVPGLGQAYAKSNWKTALFGALEVGIIGVSIGYNIAGRNATEDAYDYADKHYDPGDSLFSGYYGELYDFFERTNGDTSATSQDLIDEIYYPMNDNEPFMDTYDRHRSRRTDRYYDWIEGKSFVQGWDDCAPAYDTIFSANPDEELVTPHGTFVVHESADSAYLVYRSSDSDMLYYGYSAHQATYSDMLSTANAYYRTSTNVLFLLLINHIASAIDAGITAKRYNDELLGRESLWEHIGVEQRLVNTGSEVVPGYSLCIRF